MDELSVRRVLPGDGPLVREVRLRALADAPGAFASTFAAEAARPAAVWRLAAERRAAGDETTLLLVSPDGAVHGLVGGELRPRRRDTLHVVSMWVEPGVRGRGWGTALMDAVMAWGRQAGARRAELWVADGNAAAQALYERLGFSRAGPTQPLPSDPGRQESLLERPL